MNNKSIIIVIIIIVAILGVGGYFLFKDENAPAANNISGDIPENIKENQNNGNEENENKQPENNNQNNNTQSVKEFTIDGYEFKFEPANIKVKKGDKVKITFKNEGQYGHNLVIQDLNVKTSVIKNEESETIEFKVSEAGTYEIICSLPGHKDRGMVGKLVVEE